MDKYTEYTGKVVTLMLCSDCNIGCKHCYISYNGNRTVEELSTMIPILQSKGYRIDLNGAEVLTNPDYLRFYKDTGNNELMTNGLAIYNDPTLIDKIKENEITIVSLSYHFGMHSIISPIDEAVVKFVIEMCVRNGLKVLINTTISISNYTLIEKICARAYSLGASAIRFTNFVNQGNVLKNDIMKYALSQEQTEVFFEQLNRVRGMYDKDKFYIHRSGLFGQDCNNDASRFLCTAGWDDITITPDNSIYPCIFLAKKGFEIGVYEDGIIKMKENYVNDGCRCCARRILNNQ